MIPEARLPRGFDGGKRRHVLKIIAKTIPRTFLPSGAALFEKRAGAQVSIITQSGSNAPRGLVNPVYSTPFSKNRFSDVRRPATENQTVRLPVPYVQADERKARRLEL